MLLLAEMLSLRMTTNLVTCPVKQRGVYLQWIIVNRCTVNRIVQRVVILHPWCHQGNPLFSCKDLGLDRVCNRTSRLQNGIVNMFLRKNVSQVEFKSHLYHTWLLNNNMINIHANSFVVIPIILYVL